MCQELLAYINPLQVKFQPGLAFSNYNIVQKALHPVGCVIRTPKISRVYSLALFHKVSRTVGLSLQG